MLRMRGRTFFRTIRSRHHLIGVARPGVGERQVEDAEPISSRARRTCSTMRSGPPQKLIGNTRPTLPGAARRRHCACLLDQRLAQASAIGTAPGRCCPGKRRIGLVVGFGEDHVGAVDDVVRPRLPAILGTALAVVAVDFAIRSKVP